MNLRGHPVEKRRRGFTLVELMVSITIFSVLMIALFEMLNQTQRVHAKTKAELGQFQQTEKAFQMMTRRISEATLNPYWDYEYPNGDRTKTPTKYVRASELHFVSGWTRDLIGYSATPSLTDITPVGLNATHSIFFQGPFGFHDPSHWDNFNLLLNSWGYYVQVTEDINDRPAHAPPSKVATRRRFRLMEFRVPAEQNLIYDPNFAESSASYHPYGWFRQFCPPTDPNSMARPIAENVVALFISPQTSEEPNSGVQPTAIAPKYAYDTRAYQNAGGVNVGTNTAQSRHQLPPLVRVTMVALDEASAIRFQAVLDAGNVSANPTLLPLLQLLQGTLFSNPQNFETDLNLVEGALVELGLNYRIFSSTVRLRNARWSESN